MRKILTADNTNELLVDLPNTFRFSKHLTKGYCEHFHTLMEIYGVVSGEVVCKVGEEETVLKEGQYVCISPLVIHSYVVVQDAVVCLLQIGDMYLRDYHTVYAQNKPKMFLLDSNYNKRITDTVNAVLSYGDNVPELVKYAYVNLILNDIVTHYGTEPIIRENRKQTQSDMKLASSLLDYIYRNYQKPITLNSLANEFGMSPMAMSRFISHCLGVDLRILVNNVRVQMYYFFRQDVKYDKISNRELAYSCGFRNQQTFNAAYMRNFGSAVPDKN